MVNGLQFTDKTCFSFGVLINGEDYLLVMKTNNKQGTEGWLSDRPAFASCPSALEGLSKN
jgi:hypothetical protein